jgi:hypothetical protein
MLLGKEFFLFLSMKYLFFFSWEIYRLKHHRIKQQHAGQIFGFTSCLARFPNDNACIIVLSNLEETSIDDLIDRLTDILFDEKN